METYVEQLSSLKIHINQLQEDFGEFESLNELHEMVIHNLLYFVILRSVSLC